MATSLRIDEDDIEAVHQAKRELSAALGDDLTAGEAAGLAARAVIAHPELREQIADDQLPETVVAHGDLYQPDTDAGDGEGSA